MSYFNMESGVSSGPTSLVGGENIGSYTSSATSFDIPGLTVGTPYILITYRNGGSSVTTPEIDDSTSSNFTYSSMGVLNSSTSSSVPRGAMYLIHPTNSSITVGTKGSANYCSIYTIN